MTKKNSFKTTMGSHILIVPPSIKNFIYVFTSLKYTKYKILNLFGLQVVRYFLAKIMYFINTIKYKGKNLYPNYNHLGYYVVENALPEVELDKLKVEFEKVIKAKAINFFDKKENDWKSSKDITVDPFLANNSVEMHAYEFKFDDKEKEDYPEMFRLFQSKFINGSFSFAEKKSNPTITMRAERMIQKDDLNNEFNGLWHSDTFHDTHKAFLYLTDVKKESGPYTYLEGSCKTNLRAFIMEYLNSIKFSFNKSTRSFRLDTKTADFPNHKIKQVICKSNSFLITNTHGFHRRGESVKGTIRDSIHFWTRENPFKIKK